MVWVADVSLSFPLVIQKVMAGRLFWFDSQVTMGAKLNPVRRLIGLLSKVASIMDSCLRDKAVDKGLIRKGPKL